MAFRADLWLQTLQMYGFNLECIACTCFFKLLLSENTFWQISHCLGFAQDGTSIIVLSRCVTLWFFN